MTIKPVTGRAFKPFGRVIKGYYLRSLIEEMEKTDYDDIDLNSPDAEEDFKNQAIDDEEMDKLIEKIPESDIDEASVDAARLSNENSPVDPDDYIGAPLESVMYDIDALIPETEEF